MKIIDRYVLGSLVVSFLIFLGVVLGFYIVIDLFERFNRFADYIELQEKLGLEASLLYEIAVHYLYNSPLLMYALMPIITLMASMFTVTRMSRSNELVCLRSSGISTHRILLPFVVFAFMISLLMVGLQEVVIPGFSKEIAGTKKINNRRVYFHDLQFLDSQERMFFVGLFYPHEKIMNNIRMTTLGHKDGKLVAKKVIEAKKGTWAKDNPQKIILQEGHVYRYLHSGDIIKESLPEQGEEIESNLSASRLMFPSKRNLDLMSTAELWEVWQDEPNSGDVQVLLHSRLTVPLSNIALLFLGLPFILRRNNQNFFLGIGICVIFSAAFYGVNIGFLSLGYKNLMKASFASWFPIVVSFSLGIALTLDQEILNVSRRLHNQLRDTFTPAS